MSLFLVILETRGREVQGARRDQPISHSDFTDYSSTRNKRMFNVEVTLQITLKHDFSADISFVERD